MELLTYEKVGFILGGREVFFVFYAIVLPAMAVLSESARPWAKSPKQGGLGRRQLRRLDQQGKTP
jgi:hypothetical protein